MNLMKIANNNCYVFSFFYFSFAFWFVENRRWVYIRWLSWRDHTCHYL